MVKLKVKHPTLAVAREVLDIPNVDEAATEMSPALERTSNASLVDPSHRDQNSQAAEAGAIGQAAMCACGGVARSEMK
jgi:hypothetical protein